MHKCWSVLSHVAPSNRAQRRCTRVHTLGLDRDKRWQFCKLTGPIKGQSAQQRDGVDGTQLGVGVERGGGGGLDEGNMGGGG